MIISALYNLHIIIHVGFIPESPLNNYSFYFILDYLACAGQRNYEISASEKLLHICDER